METALKVKEQQEITTITAEDVKKYIAPNATDKEVYVFLNIAKSYGLNPFKREIHFVKYGTNPGQVIVGYEIYLKRAEETGTLDGWKAWVDGDKAKCIIYRKDRQYPFEWEVDRAEFNKGQSTWKAMPNFMLKKVCIAQAFRLCFPGEMGGLPYIPEEIGVDQAVTNGNGKEEKPKKIEPEPTTVQEPAATQNDIGVDHLRASIRAMVKEMYSDKASMMQYMKNLCGAEFKSLDDIADDKITGLYHTVCNDYNEVGNG